MKKCTRTDNEKVSILLAIYNPNIEWLKELLISIDKQIYSNIELFAQDDCSTKVNIETLISIFNKCLSNVKWSLSRNKKNIGSNRTFELLTKKADGDYFAYCDQDDIWYPNKISKLVDLINKTNSVLVCSDMEIIDKNGMKTADSITKIRKRHIFRRGTNLSRGLLQNNFVTGCTMLIKGNIAKKAIPFELEMYHDHWLALFSSTVGKIDYTEERLVKYRIHSNNQSGVLSGINNKKEYYADRIYSTEKRYKSLAKRFKYNKDIYCLIKKQIKWIEARKRYSIKANFNDLIIIFNGRKYGKHTTILEIFMPFMPNFLFSIVLKLTKKGLL